MKRASYMPIRYEWLDSLKGNELLVYAYLMHRLEISKLVDETGTATAYISRNEIADMLRMSPPRVSEAVKKLQESGLIIAEKDGRKWYFKGTKNVPEKVRKTYQKGTENVPQRYEKRTTPILLYKESIKESIKETNKNDFLKKSNKPSYDEELFKRKAVGEIKYRKRG